MSKNKFNKYNKYSFNTETAPVSEPIPEPVPEPVPEPAPAPVKKSKKPIIKGSTIRFTGEKSYSGIRLGHSIKNKVYKVIELSGDRVVIGEGSIIVAAVNVKDCEVV